MRRKWKRGLAAVLGAAMLFGGMVQAAEVKADAVSSKKYLSLGADLKDGEKSTVLDLLGVEEGKLEDYTIVSITNEDEHKYLDAYLSAKVIGKRALSSAVVVQREEGSGIRVTTQNITYCTAGMYQSALATAGIKDADVRVAGPFAISGTAALVGVIKAYSTMTGEVLEPEQVDAAAEELVATSILGENLNNQEKAEELIGIIKDKVVSGEIGNPEEIEKIINETAEKLEVNLSEEDRARIRRLMEKIAGLDLDIDSLKKQAQGVYEKLKDLDIDIDISEEEVKGFLDRIIAWLGKIWDAIVEFVVNLFK